MSENRVIEVKAPKRGGLVLIKIKSPADQWREDRKIFLSTAEARQLLNALPRAIQLASMGPRRYDDPDPRGDDERL